MVTTSHTDRGQLLLIGAVGIAISIIGLAVVVNTVIFTGDIATGTTTEQTGSADAFDQETREAVASLILRLNHENRNKTASELRTDVTTNVRRYNRLAQEGSLASRAAVTNVSFDNSSAATTWGRRIVQSGDGPFTDASGNPNWSPVPNGRTVGYFALNVNMNDVSDERVKITATSASTGEQVIWTVNVTGNRPGSDVNVTSEVTTTGATTSVSCDADGNRVLLNLVTGTSFTSRCNFNGLSELEAPHTITVENGDAVNGKYDIVVDDPVGGVGVHYQRCDVSSSPPPSQPCSTPVIWRANVATVYQTTDVNYQNAHNISIYREQP